MKVCLSSLGTHEQNILHFDFASEWFYCNCRYWCNGLLTLYKVMQWRFFLLKRQFHCKRNKNALQVVRGKKPNLVSDKLSNSYTRKTNCAYCLTFYFATLLAPYKNKLFCFKFLWRVLILPFSCIWVVVNIHPNTIIVKCNVHIKTLA